MEAGAYSELCETSEMESFGKIVDNLKLLTIVTKRSISDFWQDSNYTSVMNTFLLCKSMDWFLYDSDSVMKELNSSDIITTEIYVLLIRRLC